MCFLKNNRYKHNGLICTMNSQVRKPPVYGIHDYNNDLQSSFIFKKMPCNVHPCLDIQFTLPIL